MGSCQERVGKTRLIAAQFLSHDDESVRTTSAQVNTSPGIYSTVDGAREILLTRSMF